MTHHLSERVGAREHEIKQALLVLSNHKVGHTYRARSQAIGTLMDSALSPELPDFKLNSFLIYKYAQKKAF